MRLPIMAQPVERTATATASKPTGVTPSDCCPNNKHCEGLCMLGQCWGKCV